MATRIFRLVPAKAFIISLVLAGLLACSDSSVEAPAAATPTPASSAITDSTFESPLDLSVTPATEISSSPVPTPAEAATPAATYEVVLNEFSTLAGEVLLDGKRIYYITTPLYGSLVLTGIAATEQEIWVINNESNSIISLNVTSGEISQTFSFPAELGPDPSLSGLAWDGQNFWLADAASRTISQYDARFENKGPSFAVPNPPGDIAWDGQAVWVVSRETLELQQWSPQGEQLDSQDVTGSWITGLTWGAGRLWYSDTSDKTVWMWNPATRSGEIIIVDALAEGSFGGMGWRDNSLLLLDDMGGRLLSFDVDEWGFVK